MKISITFVLFVLICVKNILAIGIDTLRIDDTKFIVDSIATKGNIKTEDYIILRELTFQKGDSVNQEILHYNRERVFSLRLFNRVEIYGQSNENKKIVIVEVVESWYIYPIPFFRVQNGSIKNSTVGINFTFKNFRGRNETLRAVLGFGYDSFISLFYENPVLFYYQDIGASVGFGYSNYTNRSITAEQIVGYSFAYKIFYTSLSIYKRLNQFNLIGTNLAYEYWQTPGGQKSGVTASGSSIDRNPVLSIYYFYDTRDLKQFSQNGIYYFINFTHKGFGLNNVSYNIFDLDFREYRNIIKSLTSKWRINYRHTFGKTVPFYDYSYLGYGEKIRGHFMDHVEGQNSFLSSVELSYPILQEWNLSFKLPLIPQSLTSARVGIFINAFVDGGLAYNNGEALALNKFYSGYGLGITILALPYSAVRFEYAINELGKGEFVFATGFSF